MAKGQNKEQAPTLGQEISSVFGVFLAVFLLLSFVSYAPAATGAAPSNWCGTAGHLIAGVFLSFLGVSSYWLIILLLFFSIQYFSSSASLDRLPHICAGCTGLLIASSGLIAAFNGVGSDVFNILGQSHSPGGYLGKLLFGFLETYFGWYGTILMLVLLFVFSLMISVRFSPYFMSRKMFNIFGRLGESYLKRSPADKKKAKKKDKKEPEPQEEKDRSVPSVREPIRIISDDEDEQEGDFQVTPVSSGEYILPNLGLLDKIDHQQFELDHEHYYKISKRLEDKLKDFGVSGKVVGISPGPVITTYEFAPAPGIKINKIASLSDDLAMGLKAESVRIVGSVPGKAAVGIEIPNPEREIVYIRDIIGSEEFRGTRSKLSLGLGMDVIGKPVVADLARMPHLLIAGATGSGKSVAINAIICSILFKATPEEVRFLMIDPKRIELSGYEAIPHLLHPVVVAPKMANRALQWAVREMERRYELLEEVRVKNYNEYNEVSEEKLPLIVIVVDELADLMMASSREVEDSIARLAQMARAAGIHLILATQRPSVDVLTGLIKANFPTRISFKVFSKVDSRTILDISGAEHLLGEGDMLFLPPGTARLQRIHGAYISTGETERIISFLRDQGGAHYDESVLKVVEASEEKEQSVNGEEYDEKYDEAVAIVCETGQASISMVQRRLRVGYNRAARMIEVMEKEGIVGPADGSKPREVLVRKDY